LKFTLFFFAVILLMPFLFNSCIPSKPTEDYELLPSERLINRLEANRRRIKNFEGVGVIEIQSDLYNNDASFRVVMQKPDSIYFTILGPFGIELAQALVTEKDYIFYDALHNTAYTGLVTDEVLQNIFKINLKFSDFLDAFVGSVNLTEHLYKQPDKYSVDYDNYVLTYTDSLTGVETTYRVDVRELGITNYTIQSPNSELNIEGNYSDFQLIENVAVPFHIEITNKAADQKVIIKYKNIVANQRDISIDFELPDDVNVVSW
jgi:Domain of unknown function (DUF4292)